MPRYSQVYEVVRKIPRGRVATYGQIARLAGIPGHARQIGYALSALQADSTVPWHRVVNAKGEISARSATGYDVVQQRLLEQEGVTFDQRGRVALQRFGWRPRSRVAY